MTAANHNHLCTLVLDQDQKQMIETDDTMFPFRSFDNDLQRMPTKEIPWHWHEEVELIYMMEGSAYAEVAQETIMLHPGEGLFINANMLHAVHPGKVNAIFISLVFDAHLLGDGGGMMQQQFIDPLIASADIPFVHFTKQEAWHQEAAVCMKTAYSLYRTRSYGYELLVREQLSHLWYFLVNHTASMQKPIREHVDLQRMKMMMNYIHMHYQQDLTLHRIACAANISDREALRCFHKTIHDSPISYLLKYRLAQAADYLTKSEYSVTEVCALCGFKDSSYFAKCFRRNFKETPRAYRMNHQNQ